MTYIVGDPSILIDGSLPNVTKIKQVDSNFFVSTGKDGLFPISRNDLELKLIPVDSGMIALVPKNAVSVNPSYEFAVQEITLNDDEEIIITDDDFKRIIKIGEYKIEIQ